MYIDCNQFPHDANLTAELISKAVLDCKVSLIITNFNIRTISVLIVFYYTAVMTNYLVAYICRWTTHVETTRINILLYISH